MSPQVRKSDLSYPPTVLPESAGGARLRYMQRRRVATQDRDGDPLDGLVSLWVIALVLLVAFLLAALTGLGLSGALAGDDFIVVTNPGDPDMQVTVRNGSTIQSYGPVSEDAASGGALLGEFYRLADGTIIYVPAGATAPGGVAAPMATPTPDVYPTPTPDAYPAPTPATTGGVYATPTPPPFMTPAPTPTDPHKKGGG
jgi:hypothetical protein